MIITRTDLRLYRIGARCAGVSPTLRRRHIAQQYAVQSAPFPHHITSFEHRVSRLMMRFESWWSWTQHPTPRRQRKRWAEADLRTWLTALLAQHRSGQPLPTIRPGPTIVGCTCACHR